MLLYIDKFHIFLSIFVIFIFAHIFILHVAILPNGVAYDV